MRPRIRPYGRLVLGPDGALEAIVEAKDATPQQRAITLCNSGVMVLDGAHAAALVNAIATAMPRASIT